MSDPVLRIKFENGEGKPLTNTIEIRVQEGLSSRLAKQVVAELGMTKFKTALEAALPALGFK